ncbi:MAG: FAD-dependent oxidoreductase, partial [Armatimonadetes bacterium]|nr:FAD-dependent oxidoreductase [Armatimonadota bacterium]
RLTRDGNALLRAYCRERGLRVHTCGKLVVARDESELAGLDELKRRGDANGVTLEPISAAEARQIEPRVKTFQRALFSPNTATVDPTEVMAALARDAAAEGVRIATGAAYVGRQGATVRTTAGDWECGYLVNAAGLYADRIARDWGFSQRYQILPFKGLYLYSSEPNGSFRTNLYPVPNLGNPFLGVHFTVTVDGRAKIGPTAIPCLWREQYDFWNRFHLDEFVEIFGASLGLFFRAGFDFRGLALEEIKKYSRPYLVSQARALAEGVRDEEYTHWGKPGIRAQLFDREKRTLVMDFVVEGDDRSCHVLNAVSPAFTCSLSFSRHVCEQIAVWRGRSG